MNSDLNPYVLTPRPIDDMSSVATKKKTYRGENKNQVTFTFLVRISKVPAVTTSVAQRESILSEERRVNRLLVV